MDPLDIVGDEPALVGAVCEDLQVVEYWYEGELCEPANTIHMRFLGAWHCLYFDHGIIFWKREEKGPQGFAAEELSAEYRVVDIARQRGVQGLRLSSLRSTPIEGGSEVVLEFSGGPSLSFQCVDDVTSWSG